MRATTVTEHPSVARPLAPSSARLLEAMARVVAEKGYAATTVADVVTAANVSRSTFYESFAGKEDLFLQAYRHGLDVLVDRVRDAVRAEQGWREQLRAGIRAYLATLAADPLFARTYLLEIQAAGPNALAARAEALERFAARYRASAALARAEHPGLADPPEEALLLLCAGTDQLVADRVRRGEIARLGDLEDVFCSCAEAVLLGAHQSPDPQES